MRYNININKSQTYHVTFAHCLDDTDMIEQTVIGRAFWRMRSFMADMGYEVRSVEEVTMVDS